MSSKTETASLAAAINSNENYELEIHYESKLLQVFNETTRINKSGKIQDHSDWDRLIVNFKVNRLISLENAEKLEKFKPSLPLDFQTIRETIT